MANIFVISDTHFGHDNIIKYCNRPFSNSEEMDEKMVENWNSVVTEQDHVWHLGDVFMCAEQKAAKTLGRLKGKKRLVLGNHDNGKQKLLHIAFQKIVMWRMFPEFGLLLTHVPVHQSALRRGVTGNEENPPELKNIHGHTHTNTVTFHSAPDTPDPRYKNLSVEQINYTPVSIEELRIR